jgi:hypothetical protein
MIDESSLQHILTRLRSLDSSRIGELAETCAITMKEISNPAALRVSLRLPGLPEESYEYGTRRYLEFLDRHLKNLGFDVESANLQKPGFVTISTDTEETVCIGAIRHLGNILGFAGAVETTHKKGIIPIADSAGLVIAQIESRINAIMAPGSPSSLEVLARRLLDGLSDIGVCAICVKPEKPTHVIISVAQTDKEISVCDVDEFPYEKPEQVKPGNEIKDSEIRLLWPGIAGIEAGTWVIDSQNRLIAFGFSDKKRLNKTALAKIEKQLQVSAEDDIEYIVQSFEKLKANYKKMVNSERAAAVTETAVTVNHEINNPLTAILGNAQLLLMNKDKLSKETVAKLETIEKSAVQIREVTDKLMTIIEPVRKHYASGLQMIDVENSKKKPPEKK